MAWNLQALEEGCVPEKGDCLVLSLSDLDGL